MKAQRFGRALAFASLSFGVLAVAALGQVHPPRAVPPIEHLPIAVPHTSPLPRVSLAPIALPSVTMAPIDQLAKKRYVHAVRSGRRVPLFRLPHLPMRTALNTIRPGRHHHGGRYRPLAATGATIGITAAASCATGGTLGDLFNVGCQLTIQASGMSGWSGSDHYQYYVVPPNATTATEIGGAGGGCAPTTDPWTAGSPPSCSGGSTTLSTAGTYGFFVYDTTAQVLAAAVYVNAGPVFTIQVFQDPYHSEQSYQFDTQSSTAAYIYLQNVAPSDQYVAYVMSTGVNAYCVYMSPSGGTLSGPSPRPTGSTNNLVCNPKLATGVNAPGGNLALTWPFNTGLESGSYEIAVFDQTANNGAGELLGTVQVSLTGFASESILTEGSTPAPNPSKGPNAPSSTTQVAWDSTNDQAVAGITGTTQGSIPAGTYTWTISDPNGRVLSSNSETLASNGIATNDFVFNSLAINPPGEYPSANWVMQLYNTSTKSVLGSQAFQILGYSEQTQFDESGTFSPALNFTGNGALNGVGLRITNTSNTNYPGEDDSFSEMEYSTGVSTSAGAMTLPPSNTGETGVFVTLGNGASISSCYPDCTLQVNDSNGNAWTIADYCSAANLNDNGACALLYTPVNASTVLTPGAYIEIPSADMTWYANGRKTGWACYYTPCSAPTSVLPTHGLAWSSTSASSPAWTVTSFGSNISGGTISGNVSLAIAGSCTYTSNCNTSRSTTSPYAGTHFYQLNFLQGDYQLSTPFTPTGGRSDIVGFAIDNTTSFNDAFDQLAFDFPGYFSASQVHLDTLTDSSGANWAVESCPSGFGPTYICLSDGGNGDLSNGTTETIYLDVPMTSSSFPISEFGVQGYSAGELLWQGLSANSSATQPICGGGTTCSSGNIDGLGFEMYSLNSGLQSASFQPSTVGTGTNPTSLSLVIQNTSSAADPNPDAVDAVVVEQTTSSAWKISGAPTLSNASWSSLSGTGYNVAGNAMEYWFGVCANQYTNHTSYPGGGPPQSPPSPTSPTSPLTTRVTPCTTGQEENSLAAGGSLTINFALNTAFSAGTQTFYVYTHGANGGGWSAPKPVTLTINSESASANLFSVNGAVLSGALANVSGTPNTFVYEVKNTSNTANIAKVDIQLPAYDINGQPATDGSYSWTLVGSPITTNIVLGTITGGTFKTTGVPAGCTVNSADTFNPVAGTSNGQIEVSGCTGLSPGKILAVEFESNVPQSQSDSYLLPVTIDGTTAGLAYIGADQVTVSFSIGITVVVDPGNPGPGGSTPVVNCSQCAFSGTTIDYGPIGNSSSVTGADVVRASVIYTGSTQAGKTWQMSVSGNNNPTCTGASCGGIPYELLTSADPSKTDSPAGNSNTNCSGGTIHVTQTAYAAMPTGAPMNLATGSENQCTGSQDYDVLQNYKVQVGTESTNGQSVTILYTLIAN